MEQAERRINELNKRTMAFIETGEHKEKSEEKQRA